jgi:hypothetical protein
MKLARHHIHQTSTAMFGKVGSDQIAPSLGTTVSIIYGSELRPFPEILSQSFYRPSTGVPAMKRYQMLAGDAPLRLCPDARPER